MKDNIKTMRKQHKLTQLALAQKAGLSESQISKYETGRRNPDLVSQLKIAGAFGVQPSEVFPDIDFTPPMSDQFGSL